MCCRLLAKSHIRTSRQRGSDGFWRDDDHRQAETTRFRAILHRRVHFSARMGVDDGDGARRDGSAERRVTQRTMRPRLECERAVFLANEKRRTLMREPAIASLGEQEVIPAVSLRPTQIAAPEETNQQ